MNKVLSIITPIIIACLVFAMSRTAKSGANQEYDAAVERYGQEYVDAFYALKAGDIFTFGSFEQDNKTANGKEPIEWLVLEHDGDRVLLVSRYALDCQQFYTSFTYTPWETSLLREWLNDSFLYTAFSDEELAMIPSVTVKADKNPDYNANPGNSTTDKVFLLSIPEVYRFFSTDEDRKCVPTDYAIAQGAWTGDEYKVGGKSTCWWWLRSPGLDSDFAAIVHINGSVFPEGDYVDDNRNAVRPALWVSLGK